LSRDNKNRDTKGRKGTNTSADAGHRHDETRKNWETKEIKKQRTSVLKLLKLEVRLAGED
jgi:hypothetical protein